MNDVDPLTGELRQYSCDSCQKLANEKAGLETELDALQAAHRYALVRIRALHRDRDKEREGDPMRDEIISVFDHWRERFHPRARFTPDRFDLIKKQMKHYTSRELKMAIDGAAANPWVIRGETVVTDRLGSIFKSADSIEGWVNRALRWKARFNRFTFDECRAEYVKAHLLTAEGDDSGFDAHCPVPRCDGKVTVLNLREADPLKRQFISSCSNGCEPLTVSDHLTRRYEQRGRR